MKNLLKKSLILALGCMMVGNVYATSPVALAAGTYDMTGAPNTGNSKVFKMYKDIYYGRSGSGLTCSNGIEAKSGSMIAFQIAQKSTIKFEVLNSKNKEITDTWSVKTISTNDFNGIIQQYDNGGKNDTYYSNSNSEICTISITHGSKANTTTTSETNETPALEAGIYGFYLSSHTADGDFVTKIIITSSGSSTVIPVSGVNLNKTTLTIEEGKSEKLTATVDPRGATNTKVTWTSSDPTVATVDADGNITALKEGTTVITVKTDDGGFTATCTVTVTKSTTPIVKVTGVSIAKSETELTLYINDTHQITYSVSPADATNKAVTWSVDNSAVVSVKDGLVTALKKGDATVTVTTLEGGYTAQSIIHVKEKEVPVPGTDLTIHETEVYESNKGYGTDLTVFDGREYEVYYVTRDSESDFCVATINQDKVSGITTRKSDYECTALDGWFNLKGTGWSSSSDAMGQEFGTMIRRLDLDNTSEFTMHIKGFDQFAIVARDKKIDDTSGGSKPENNRFLEVYVDNVLQPQQFNTAPSIRRYNISTQEHVIRIVHTGSEKSAMYAFSLRVAYVPKLKRLNGNDSTQTVMQTLQMTPVTYYLKNKVSDAEFSWSGTPLAGVTMQKADGDTLIVSGTAGSKNGEYKYTITAKDEDSKIVSTIQGKILVGSKITYQRMIDSVKTVYEKSAIEPVVFYYYSIDKDDLSWKWTSQTPAGLSFAVDESKHTVSLTGTPTTVGTFPYELSLKDANTLQGKIIVESSSPVVVPGSQGTMLYLYKQTRSNGVYTDLTKSYNYFARPAGGMSEKEVDYSAYDFIIISEDVDANNDEVLHIINDVKKPVLNMKNFTYTTSRLGWGYPDNGSITNTKIKVLQPQHPVFKGFNVQEGSEIEVLKEVSGRGLMPTEVTLQGSYALATAPKQGEIYEEDGEPETFIHEVPQKTRGAKYILFPLSQQSASNLTNDGKKLLQNVIDYLLSTEESKVTLPELRITEFSIDGHKATIDESNQEIRLEMPEGTDLTALSPVITVADQKTKVTPTSGSVLNMSDSYFGVDFTVSDFINKKVYTAYITTATGLENMSEEGLWYDGSVLHNPQGKWVYIYNVQGMLITTTNSDFSFESMPHSMYMIVTETGVTKLMR